MAYSQNTEIKNVISKGPGLTFIAYPQAVTLLSLSPLWSTMFFLMLSTLALSSMFPNVENVVTALIDQFGQLRPYKFWMTGIVCLVSFLFGLSMTTNGGMFVLQLLDSYGVGYAILFVGLAEIIAVAWRYGGGRLIHNIGEMLGHKWTFVIWKWIWIVFTPSILIFAIVFTLIKSSPPKYGTYTFPQWAVSLGWLLTWSALIPIIVYALFALVHHLLHEGRGKGLLNALKVLTSPTSDWTPALPQYRSSVR